MPGESSKKVTITNYSKETKESVETNWSDDSLIKLCTNAEQTAIVIGKLSPQRQMQLLSILNLSEMINEPADFYLIYDAASELAKVHLLFETGDKSGITDTLIQSALRKIEDRILIEYINDKMHTGQDNFLLDGIEKDPAGFLQNKYAIAKFNENPPRLSAFESSFSIFYSQKNQSIKQQLNAVEVLDRFLSGGNIDLTEVSSVITTLNQTSKLFNTEAIANLAESIQQARKQDSTTEEIGYSSDDSGYDSDSSSFSN